MRPGRVESIFRSLQHVNASHLLDRELYDFCGLAASGRTSDSESK
jgi:hypothetical protein